MQLLFSSITEELKYITTNHSENLSPPPLSLCFSPSLPLSLSQGISRASHFPDIVLILSFIIALHFLL